MDIIKAINDQNLFRPLFRDLSTWASWQVFLKALFALPMSKEELKVYRECTGRQDAPKTPFRECWCPTGVRSGKSFIAALVAVFLACFKDYRPHLAPGERAEILIIASDRTQAGVIFRYIRGFLSANPMMTRLVESEKTESIDLTNRVTIRVATCSYRSIRGFTAAAVICDEVAYWRSDDGANPGTEVLRALRPRLATIPNSLLLAISSPYARSGPLWQAFTDHHGKDDSDVLCWKAPTRLMNPTIPQALIDRDMTLDPEAARSEWEAEFRSDLEAYLPLEAIEAAMVQGRYELPPMSGLNYVSFVDPSGGRRDAATLAIGHLEKEVVILDLARHWRAPHDPGIVAEAMAEVLKTYRIFQVTGDRYGGEWPAQEFRKHGITYQPSEKDKSVIYLEFLPMMLSGRVELLDNKTLGGELRTLERRTRKGGRDLVDHPPKLHDDLANSVAGVCTVLAVGRGVTSWGLIEFYKQEAEKMKQGQTGPPSQEAIIH
jgi:hypothetical protein